MWNEPTTAMLSRLPRLYETESVPLEEKIIHVHFFLGGCDWYVAEYDAASRVFFGYAILKNDLQNAEWGYFSLDELRDVRTRQGIEVDRDLFWKPVRAGEVERIREAHESKGLVGRLGPGLGKMFASPQSHPKRG